MIRTEPAPHLPLKITGVWKSYPGVLAVRGADFQCAAGEIHALVGENGAGKTTLMNIASGNVAPDEGEVLIAGHNLQASTPRLARQLGLAMVYQDDSLIPDLSVAQNLLFGASSAQRPGFSGLNDWAEEQLRRFEMLIDPRTLVRDLSVSPRQIVEILKALISEPQVLVLDEPTSALAGNEVDRLHEVLRAIVTSGTSVVYITHRLREVFDVAGAVSVMRDGEMVRADMAVVDTTEDELVSLMVGRSFQAAFPPKPQPSESNTILTVRDLYSERFQGVSFEGYAGEILGIAGIEGNGQHEFIRALAGLGPHSGSVTVNGLQVPAENVNAARQHGIVFISGDRRGEALFMGLGVRENMTIDSLPKFARLGLVSIPLEREAVQKQIDFLDLRTPRQEQPVFLLSGGNQQKVALGRAFLEQPTVYVIDEPTQGVDAATRLEIYRHLRLAAEAGAPVIVLSSDAVELSGLCDRVLVFVRGRIVQDLSGSSLTEDNLVSASVRMDVRQERTGSLSQATGLLHLARTSDLAAVALLLLSIALVATTAGLARPLFFTPLNLRNLLFLAIPLGFAALAQAIVMLVGGIDLSIGPLMALVTVSMAQIMKPDAGPANTALAVVVSIGIGLVIGMINALLVLRVRLLPLIATLATFIFVQGVALLWSPFTGGFVSPDFIDGAKFTVGSIPLAFLLLTAIAIAGELVYRRSSLGMAFRAVGSRPAAARRLGLRTNVIHFMAYILAAFFGVIAGIFFTTTIGTGDPRLGINFTLASITAVVLGGLSTWGGRGSVIGPLLGAVLLALITNASAFMNFPSEVQFYVQGGLTIAAIALYSRLRATGRSYDETAAR